MPSNLGAARMKDASSNRAVCPRSFDPTHNEVQFWAVDGRGVEVIAGFRSPAWIRRRIIGGIFGDIDDIFTISIKAQLYLQQLMAFSYIHRSIGACHWDMKPQNLLVNPHTHQVKLCDFGSAKVLVKGEPNISYICLRYYSARELIFGATELFEFKCARKHENGSPFPTSEYTMAIDMWCAGCVLAELLRGQPLFPGESGLDQLVEIIKVLGTPTREEIKCMNPYYTEFKFPQIKAHPWHKVYIHKCMPPEAVELVSRLLHYSPNLRCTALDALIHPFFDELRDPNACLPNGQFLLPLFKFKSNDLTVLLKLIPEHAKKQCASVGL
ncbi:hypothetical protein ACJRO7_030750 [Eucalyptus globulus]|uniref:Protein kinase domain-containing protein n=1 Tax=Eucalyptus globulus TaxID=34317 RepID=A0ABD3JHK1_EUCGL